jgi:hypothetical protein
MTALSWIDCRISGFQSLFELSLNGGRVFHRAIVEFKVI